MIYKLNKSKNYTCIPFITWFCWKSKNSKFYNYSVQIKGFDNGDLDNQGPTVSCLFILQYVAMVQI